MPKNSKSRSSHKGESLLQYSPAAIHQAEFAYFHQSVEVKRGYKSIAKQYGVPAETLRRKIKRRANAGRGSKLTDFFIFVFYLITK